MERKPVNWERLQALRERFLNPRPGVYWESAADLDLYAQTFGARIGSKWAAVWAELLPRLPEKLTVWDWGCGTGVASAALVELGQVEKVYVSDHSSLARDYAAEKLRARGVETYVLEKGTPEEPYWLVVSHVWNELDKAGQDALRAALLGAYGFTWVEPGTPELSRALIEARDGWASQFSWLGPCPHHAACGMRTREKDWCHFFAPPDPDVFTSSEWSRFSKQMQIDLRALPVSFLSGIREKTAVKDLGRVIGRPRVFKGFAKALVCRESGVAEETLKPTGDQKLKDFREIVFCREK